MSGEWLKSFIRSYLNAKPSISVERDAFGIFFFSRLSVFVLVVLT